MLKVIGFVKISMLLSLAHSVPMKSDGRESQTTVNHAEYNETTMAVIPSWWLKKLQEFMSYLDESAEKAPPAPVTATIHNGPLAQIASRSNDFLHCSISDSSIENLHEYEIVWIDPKGKEVGPYRCGKNKKKCRKFTINTAGVPYSYLTFVGFKRSFQGVYTCELRHKRIRVGSAQVEVLIVYGT